MRECRIISYNHYIHMQESICMCAAHNNLQLDTIDSGSVEVFTIIIRELIFYIFTVYETLL